MNMKSSGGKDAKLYFKNKRSGKKARKGLTMCCKILSQLVHVS